MKWLLYTGSHFYISQFSLPLKWYWQTFWFITRSVCVPQVVQKVFLFSIEKQYAILLFDRRSSYYAWRIIWYDFPACFSLRAMDRGRGISASCQQGGGVMETSSFFTCQMPRVPTQPLNCFFKTPIVVLKKLSDYGAPYSLFKMLQLGWVIFLSTFSQWRSYQYKGRKFCYHLWSNPGQSQAIHFHRLKDYSFSRNKSTFSFLLALQMTLVILLSRTQKIHKSKDRSEDELKYYRRLWSVDEKKIIEISIIPCTKDPHPLPHSSYTHSRITWPVLATGHQHVGLRVNDRDFRNRTVWNS